MKLYIFDSDKKYKRLFSTVNRILKKGMNIENTFFAMRKSKNILDELETLDCNMTLSYYNHKADNTIYFEQNVNNSIVVIAETK